jgi:hypothetical protein
MSDTYGRGDTPELRVDEDSGREYWQYPSGMTKWKDTGHFRTPQSITPIEADPRGMLARRNEKSRQVAREAVDAGAGLDPRLWGTGEGWFELIRHTTETFLKSSNLRGQAETLAKLGIVTGYMTREEGEGKAPPVHIENLNFVTLVADVLKARGLPANDENILNAEFSLIQEIERNRAQQSHEAPASPKKPS